MQPGPDAPVIPPIDAREAHDLLEAGTAVMIDVREPWERHEARIPGTLHIPMMEVMARMDEIPRDATIIMQCKSGQRSLHAARALAHAGYADLLNLDGGIIAWHQGGLPLEAGPE